MEKWDSYLSVLLGIFVSIVAKAVVSPKLLLLFKYYVFAMMGVVVFDTIKNVGQHESVFWKFAAIISNGILFAASSLLDAKFSAIPRHISDNRKRPLAVCV